ncbi:MAG: FMN-binding glutamate synthase family protein [Burkholderia sp.]|nr:FMN-binding glutamate synthase family protein [Burkholderia sp.]
MFSRRYLAMWSAIALLGLSTALAATQHVSWLWIVVPLALVALGIFDLTQQRHAILRNYPLWGHFRFLFEFIRPEIRQYFVENDTDEKPFSRAQRSIVYQRAKNDVDSRPYGTELDVKAVAHEWISHSLAPTTLDSHDFRIVVGADRAQPYSMSIFNVSAMSFGSLSANAIMALNLGAKKGNFAHDTGEGSMSKYHREHGGDIIWEIASGSGGKPTGFKLCIGHPWEFFGIAKAMLETGILPDFIVVDGAEGGTGAAPLEFTDHVGVPLQEGLLLVHNTLVGIGLRQRIRIGASGKMITAFDITKTLAIGADWVNAARGFMFAVGCIQAQTCHTGRCPTGVATQDPVRQRALVVPDKADRVFSFHHNTLHALKEIVQAAGLKHPAELRAHHIVRRVSSHEVQLMSELLKYLEPNDLLNGNYRYSLYEKWWPVAQSDSFSPKVELAVA